MAYAPYYPGGWQNPAGINPSGDTTGAADTAAISSVLTAGGSPVLVPGQVYYTNAPLVVPPLQGISCSGAAGTTAYYGGSTAMPLGGAVIKPTATFAGTSIDTQAVAGVIVMVSSTLGSYATGSGNQAFRGITIDGRSAPAGTNGIEAWGPVWGVLIDGCGIYGLPQYGIATSSSTPDGTGKAPDLWRLNATHIAACGSDGFNVNGGLSDSYFTNCEATGNTGNGWNMTGANVRWVDCKAEFNHTNGFRIQSQGTGAAGQQGVWMTGCSTDHNYNDGLLYFAANGTGPLMLSNCNFHGDGYVGGTGGASWAGVHVTSTNGWLIADNLAVLTISGATTPCPAYGVKNDGTASKVIVNSGIVYGNTAATNLGAGATAITLGANVQSAAATWGA